MTPDHDATRRQVLRVGGAALAVTAGAGGLASADNLRSNGDKSFGRVWANDTLWRTNVVRKLDGRPANEDRIYFLHDGEKPVVAGRPALAEVQRSPFVSESAPGDADWNGGKWSHFAAEVTDVEAFAEAAPLTSESEVLGADFLDVNETPGRPGFGPPTYFLCPLNGRA